MSGRLRHRIRQGVALPATPGLGTDMFERFTERARRVLFFARFEASQQGGTSVDTEHLLLGVLRENEGLTSRIFEVCQVSKERVRKDLEGRSLLREKVPISVEMPFSSQTARVLQFAVEEAEGLQHRHIGTEHLLLGLLREEASTAARTLATHGLHVERVRMEIVNLRNEGPSLAGRPANPVELVNQVEQIERLVEELVRTLTGGDESRDLGERVLKALDALKRRLG